MILLTGFEPFGGQSVNASWVAVQHARSILEAAGLEAETLRLPCVFGASANALAAAIEEHSPDLVICVGQAGGRSAVSLERVAINCDDARIPDNAGNSPVDQEIVPGGPAAYFSTLPLKASFVALQAAGIPAEVSQTAGTYVCNHVFYSLMHTLHSFPGIRGGFVHVPYETSQVGPEDPSPSLPPEEIAEAIAVVVRTALSTPIDIRLSAGAIH